jgi:hypothetical protein
METTEEVCIWFDHMEIKDWSRDVFMNRNSTVKDLCKEYIEMVGVRSRFPYYKDVVLHKPIDFNQTIGELFDEQTVEMAKGSSPLSWPCKMGEIQVVESVEMHVDLIGLTWKGSDYKRLYERPESTLGSALNCIDWVERLNPLDCRISINNVETVLSRDTLDQEVRNLRPYAPNRQYNVVSVKIAPHPASFSMAFMMGMHRRLGKDCRFSQGPIPEDCLRMICTMTEVKERKD